MKWPRLARIKTTAPVAIPTQPGRTVTLDDIEFVVMSLSRSQDGSASVELLERTTWESRYRLR